LGLSTPEVDERCVIIVTEIDGVPMGMLLDAISDIIAPTKDAMQSPSEVATSINSSYVQAFTLVGEKIVRVLELKSVVPPLIVAT
jgi:purine-binding chemotaxis protein CheW